MSMRAYGSAGQRVRLAVQVSFLALMGVIAYLHYRYGGGPKGYPSVDSLCPFGGLEGLYAYLTSSPWPRRLAASSFVLMVSSLVLSALLGRTFCGAVCPLGSLQEWSRAVAMRLGLGLRLRVPPRLDELLSTARFLVMGLILYFTYVYGTLVWRDYDPWVAAMHVFHYGELLGEKAIGFSVLLGSLLASAFFIPRFWCRYLCPLGAALSLPHLLAPIKVVRNEPTCIHCRACDRACPVGIRVSEAEVLRSSRCVQCGLCVDSCPVPNTLWLGTRRIKTSVALLAVASLAFFGAVYGASRYYGVWSTTDVSFAAATASRTLPPEEIRGSMTLQQVADSFGLDPDRILEEAGWPSGVSRDVPLRDLAKSLNPPREVEEIRSAVKRLLGR